MSCNHIHMDGACVTVCTGTNQRYLARVRWHGYRRYKLLGKTTKSKRVAMRRLSDAMLDPAYKRGDVLLLADWYEPVSLYEMVSK